MNRMRACNCITGSLVPVTWNEIRKPARLPTAARFSNVRNFKYADPGRPQASARHLFVNVAVQRV